MARLPILASLLTASLMTQASMPEWFTNLQEYCTVDACKNGWNNCSEFAQEQATALKDAVTEHPYYATAAAVILGYLAKKGYDVRKARNKREQEAQDRIFAEILQQIENDEAYARQLQRQYDRSVQRYTEDTTYDAAVAARLQRELEAGLYNAFNVIDRQIAADEAYARSLASGTVAVH